MKSISIFTLGVFVMIMAQACSNKEPMEIPISLDIPGKFTYAIGGEVQVLEKDKLLSTNNCQNKPNPTSYDAQWILSGSRVIYQGGCPSGIHIMDPSSGKDQIIVQGGNNGILHDASCALIGERIAVIGQDMLAIYHYDGLSAQKIDSIPTNLDANLSMSHDGETVVIYEKSGLSTQGFVHILHVGIDSIFAPQGDFGYTKSVSWSSQSDQFVFSGSLDIFVSTDNGSVTRNLTNTPDEDETSPAWSPVADEIVFVRSFPLKNRAELVLYDLKLNTADVIFRHDDLKDIRGLRWSQDGSKIAFYNDAEFNGGIYVIDRSGAELTRYTNQGLEFDWIYP